MNIRKIRDDFPFFRQEGKRKGLIYLDNACQSLRPRVVIDAVSRYYLESSACGGRSIHRLADEVTRQCEEVRSQIARFLNASRKEEIVFTRNTTEGINLVAYSLDWEKGDAVLVSDKEHNSNLLPWQGAVKRCGISLKIIPSGSDNAFDMEAFRRLLEGKVKLVSLAYTSNLDGVSIPVADVVRAAHERGALVLIDAAQAAPRRPIDVRGLDADFVAFSGHKTLGPSGTGVLYGKYRLLERLAPFMTGGGTVSSSRYEGCDFLPPPEKFEAGLQDYAGIIGLGAAVKYLGDIGFREVEAQELLLNQYVTSALREMQGLRVFGPADPAGRGGIFSFIIDGTDPHRIALMLDQMAGIMVRAGQHCVHSWFASRGIPGSVRASFSFYNTLEEAEVLVASLRKIRKVL